ncbi:MAG TPA: hypothetical protein VHX88_03860 [Solirubrobacteraceae bacterium]|jgi:hypothetical protein|nr:hypothetical protein [Solirubrobacteraceae bacterium]
MSGLVMVPWYATGFRGDTMEKDLGEISQFAMRYGALGYRVMRNRDDRYRFQQIFEFDDHNSWSRYWEGPEMIDFRVRHSGMYQIPILYSWWDLTASAQIGANGGNGPNGGNGLNDAPSPASEASHA